MAINDKIEYDDHWFTNEDKLLVFTIFQADGVTPQNITGWPLSWLLKVNRQDADVDAILTKTTAAGITLTTPLAGVCSVSIADTDTFAVPAGLYHHELKRNEPGLETVLTFGTARLINSIHRT